MKRMCALCAFCLFMALLITTVPFVHAQYIGHEDHRPTCWNPIWWVPFEEADACILPYETRPDSGLYNTMYVGRDRLARHGYPYHYALIAGINDTLDALIAFYNPPAPEEAYDLTDKGVEEWFAPQIYMNFAKGREPSVLLMDSTQLAYRVRGWSNGWSPLPAPIKLHSESWGYSDYGYYNMKLDIWNLPQGPFQLCVMPTDKIPTELHPRIGGVMVEFYPAHDLADSCNGYEGNFWRATYDSNFSVAKEWASKIIDINPHAVPGWWLVARNALDLQDTTTAIEAYDKAIDYLNDGSDPAMPDSTKGALREFDRAYIDCLRYVLPYERAQLGP